MPPIHSDQAPADLFPGPGHDHERFVVSGLARADRICRERGARLTKNRRAVLELVLAEHGLVGAYDIMNRFEWNGRRPAPAQIYRALSFLESMGLVHRIASRDAYIACRCTEEMHGTLFLLCEGCGAVAEPNGASLQSSVHAVAEACGFALRTHTAELVGLCPACAKGNDDPGAE